LPHTVVLMVGRDRVLVETRSQVLRTAGYIVVPAYTPRQAIDEFVRGDFDLVLLCHSMPEDARERLVSVIREHTSRTPIVSVASFDGQFDGFADATIENDPNLLIDSLRKIVSRNSDSSGGVQRRPAPCE
jgi:CheY-like chemotaxis protein